MIPELGLVSADGPPLAVDVGVAQIDEFSLDDQTETVCNVVAQAGKGREFERNEARFAQIQIGVGLILVKQELCVWAARFVRDRRPATRR